MSDLIPYNPDQPIRRTQSRQLSRSLVNVQNRSRLDIARIEAAAEVPGHPCRRHRLRRPPWSPERGHADPVGAAPVTMVPMASGRLAAIGDMAALAIAEAVTDTARRVR